MDLDSKCLNEKDFEININIFSYIKSILFFFKNILIFISNIFFKKKVKK